MNKDIRLSVSFFHHPKTIKLHSLLGSEGVISLLRLWCYAGQWKHSGDLSSMSDEEIECAALFVGNSGMFVKVLRDVRFIDSNNCLHDWREHNPWAAGSEKRSDMARFSRLAHTHPKLFKELTDKGVNALSRIEYDSLTEPQRSVNVPLTQSGSKRLTPSPSPSPVPSPAPKRKKERPAQAPFSLPDWIDRSTWDSYEEMRRKKRAPMTDRARELTVIKLDGLRKSGNDPKLVLEQSIEKSWTGVFELKSQGGKVNAIPERESWQQRREREQREQMERLIRG